jgi:predicted RNase H-like HicB family nuclease
MMANEVRGFDTMTDNTLHFRVERHDDEDGIYYVVNGIEIALVTQDDTLEESLHNLREAVELYYEGDSFPVSILSNTLILHSASLPPSAFALNLCLWSNP